LSIPSHQSTVVFDPLSLRDALPISVFCVFVWRLMGSSCCLGSNVVTLIFSCLQEVKHLSRGARSRSRPQIFGFSTHDSSVVDAYMRGSVGVYSVPSAVYRSLPDGCCIAYAQEHTPLRCDQMFLPSSHQLWLPGYSICSMVRNSANRWGCIVCLTVRPCWYRSSNPASVSFFRWWETIGWAMPRMSVSSPTVT